MDFAARLNPTAMVYFCQTAMRGDNYTSWFKAHEHRNITLVGVDGSDYQLAYLESKYVDGLIGQLPFEFGSKSVEVLHRIITENLVPEQDAFYRTNLVSYNLIPLELPELMVDQNLLGNLDVVGFTCFAIVAATSIVCMVWSLVYRNELVVRAVQPFFLGMVACGVLIMAGALIPLSFDDDGKIEEQSKKWATGICMSVPWLAFMGFAVIFSALFSKTWRVNRIFNTTSSPFARVRVRQRDVLAPFAAVMAANFAILISWTLVDPLVYERSFEIGTDFWNREIASNGACRSDNTIAYLVPLGVLNAAVVFFASYQAFQARHIQSEFSESSYIGLAVFMMAQAFLSGIPVVAVVRDIPEAFYLVLTFVIFVLCMVILLLVFLPKMIIRVQYAGMSEL